MDTLILDLEYAVGIKSTGVGYYPRTTVSGGTRVDTSSGIRFLAAGFDAGSSLVVDLVYALEIKEPNTQILDLSYALDAPSENLGALTLDLLYSIVYVPVEQQFELASYAEVANEINFTNNFEVAQVYNLVGTMEVPVETQFTFMQEVNDQIEVSNQFLFKQETLVSAQFVHAQEVLGEVVNQFSMQNQFVYDVANQFSIKQDVLYYNPVAAMHTFVQSIVSTFHTSVNDQPYVLFNGRRVDITSGDILTDEDSLGWTATLYLSNLNDYMLFTRDDEFSVQLYGDLYNFIVDAKSLNRDNPVGYQATLTGVSPIMKYAAPRHPPVDLSWPSPTTAKEAAEYALGESIEWDTVNWSIPGGLLSLTNGEPIKIVEQLAEAVGAVVISDPDGTIRVQPRHVEDVPDYNSASSAFVYTEEQDIYNVSEFFVAGRVENRICLSNTNANVGDRLEFEVDENDALTGILLAYPIPWREPQYVDLETTAEGNRIILSRNSPQVKYRIEEEDEDNGVLVEIVEGEASVQYPIYEITEIEWLSEPIGISYAVGSTTIKSTDPNDKYGLVRLRYKVRYQEWRLNSSLYKEAQILMLDLTE